jgi:hypothetical protein
MIMGVLTRWELTPEEKFLAFYQELQKYLKKKLTFAPLEDGREYWILDFDYIEDYMKAYYSEAEPFKHTRHFCEEKHFDWREVRQMINEYKGQTVLDDAEIVNDDF